MAKSLRELFLLFFATIMLCSCVTAEAILVFENRPLTIATLNLFNQKDGLKDQGVSKWSGDWVFRRQRLHLIEEELIRNKPDIFMMQEVINKKGSSSESDIKILKYSALNGFFIRSRQVRQYDDTQELESAVIAASFPTSFMANHKDQADMWTIGDEGYVLIATIDYQKQPIVIVNVNIPPDVVSDIWYDFIKERILVELKKEDRCKERLIIAGSLTNEIASESYQNFLEDLGLADSASGYCQDLRRCYTATSQNAIYSAAANNGAEFIQDRILVPSNSYIIDSRRGFDDFDKEGLVGAKYGLETVWASDRMGWFTTINIPRCPLIKLGLD